jgi:hypothetical protein
MGRSFLSTLLCVVLLQAGVISCAGSETNMTSARAADILKSSRDGRELKNAAVVLAKSRVPEDHKVLGRYLGKKEFLGRLDPPEAYDGRFRDLRLGRVVQTLADNRCSSADEVLVGLIGSADFQGDVFRKQILLRALAAVRPPPPTAVAYWDRLSAPESAIAGDVIEALCENQSDPALELLERKFADPSQERDNRILWMREFLLVRRNDLPLLLCCERMMTKSLPEDLKTVLAEALFDYQPEKWYRGDDPPKPPPRAKASVDAKKVLARIGRYALDNVRLTPGQAKAVKAALKELGNSGR